MAQIASNPFSRIRPIDSVSPSRAAAFIDCRLSEAFRAANTVPRLPVHPKAHFGILAHAFLHDSARGAFVGLSDTEIRSAWDKAVGEYEQRLKLRPADCGVIPLARTCDDFEVNAYRLIAAAARLSPPLGVRTPRAYPRTSGAEVEAASSDRQIVGRLDRITWEDGQITVTDIKTGTPTDREGNLRSDLKVQLLLYGYLVHERFQQWPKALRILPLAGEPISVPFVSAESETLAGELKQLLQATNQSIANILRSSGDEKTLASPSPQACRFCLFRPTCEAYWSARSANPDAGWPRDISGRLVSVKSLGGGFRVLEVRGLNGVTYVVRGVKQDALLSVAENDSVRICDLRTERAVNVYSWRPTSHIGVAGA